MTRVHASYLVCTTLRSGSSLLCEALKSTGLAGSPGEFFGSDTAWTGIGPRVTSDVVEYVAALMQRFSTPNGVFGAKLMWPQLIALTHRLKAIPEYRDAPACELLGSVFPNLHVVYLTRRDKLRQAISLLKAWQTDIWVVRQAASPAPRGDTRFDRTGIEHAMLRLNSWERLWEIYFQGCSIQPFTLAYEELVEAYEETTIGVLKHLGIPLPAEVVVGAPRIVRQADAQTEDWVRRYQELERIGGEQTARP
jgi:trehalose 2-sulfotransferase